MHLLQKKFDSKLIHGVFSYQSRNLLEGQLLCPKTTLKPQDSFHPLAYCGDLASFEPELNIAEFALAYAKLDALKFEAILNAMGDKGQVNGYSTSHQGPTMYYQQQLKKYGENVLIVINHILLISKIRLIYIRETKSLVHFVKDIVKQKKDLYKKV